MSKPHCIVIGIGPGLGAACARKFGAKGHTVSIISRSDERLAGFASEIPNTVPYRADIADIDNYRETLQRIVAEQGVPRVVIYNATLGTFAHYADVPIEKFERNFRVNTSGLLVTAQVLGPLMTEAGQGSLVVTGNTASQRGKPAFVGWSATKAAQRNLSECLARELGPAGIHVAYVVIDAVIDMPFARRRWPDRPDDFYTRPDDLAGEIYNVAYQPKSAWSFLVELRPFGETW